MLHRLLDIHEDDQQNPQRVARAFRLGTRLDKKTITGGLAEREDFNHFLQSAQKAGAIEVVAGQGELRHLVERIRLRDAHILYEFIDRRPRAQTLSHALQQLESLASTSLHPLTQEAIDQIRNGWIRCRQPLGFACGDIVACEFLRALQAVLARSPHDNRDMRTFSRAVLGDSKLLEVHQHRVVRYLASCGFLSSIPENEIYRVLGLEKFSQTVLITGPLKIAGEKIGAIPYVGIPDEGISECQPTTQVRSVLSIENLASFNRHVREAREPSDVVVYTGGFPSRATGRALAMAAQWCPDNSWHWGDIDASGIQIALHVARITGTRVRPHMMNIADAISHGTPCAPVILHAAKDTEFEPLAAFLASPQACTMEQEQLDPGLVSGMG